MQEQRNSTPDPQMQPVGPRTMAVLRFIKAALEWHTTELAGAFTFFIWAFAMQMCVVGVVYWLSKFLSHRLAVALLIVLGLFALWSAFYMSVRMHDREMDRRRSEVTR